MYSLSVIIAAILNWLDTISAEYLLDYLRSSCLGSLVSFPLCPPFPDHTDDNAIDSGLRVVHHHPSVFRVYRNSLSPGFVTSPKSVCLMLQKAKTQNIKLWSKERFVDQEDTNQEDRKLSGASHPSSKSTVKTSFM